MSCRTITTGEVNIHVINEFINHRYERQGGKETTKGILFLVSADELDVSDTEC
jgi:hypothetical protein